MRIHTLLIIFFCIPYLLMSQTEEESTVKSGRVIGITIGAAYNIPGGDLKERFGNNNEIRVGLEYQLSPSKWAASFETGFLFGNNVKEDVLAPLRLENGLVLGNNGGYANIFLRQRGVYMGLMLEKIIAGNENGRGFRLGAGAGLLNHFIRVQDDTSSVPQVAGRYKKGYDRSTRGFALKERISYNYVSDSRRMNLSFGFEFTQGFTKNVRAINFDTGLSDTQGRLDLIYALNLKWLIPLVNTVVDEEIFY